VVDQRSKTQVTIIMGLIALVASISTAGANLIANLISKPATSDQAVHLNRQLDQFERQRKDDLIAVKERQTELKDMINGLEIPPPEVKLQFIEHSRRMSNIEAGLARNWEADRKHREDESAHAIKSHVH